MENVTKHKHLNNQICKLRVGEKARDKNWKPLHPSSIFQVEYQNFI